ncbi:DUF4230 domain-containing protein [Aurantiacibacter gangjinensis]|uniref:Uncharacterized protein n=1 Tax=Aurantiacibacter gangjinensis TaxID=502682 RepID=A0A0G9MK21_9SPHN|nr:DUF4230 domain-containing protein [Aurantiacibacter gangjinensis]APE29378.1 hypothetical protein BMF35_b0123 [Aurantiacibacter gangjinensis]KLE31047.1 hypothetical protein AAW01_12385 [Aurantiacibacter gangjinensis]
MADDLISDEKSRAPRSGIRRGAPWLVVILLAAALAWLAWERWGPREEGDIIATSMVAFERQNALTVFSSRFDVVAESTSTPSVGPLPIDALESRQAMIVPATVEYRLDLSTMDRGDFAWDEAAQRLTVELPPLQVSTPNLNEAEARYFTDGIYVSRDASVSLSRSNSEIAQRRALQFARAPEIMTMARNAAREAVRQNLAIPLSVSGFENVQVDVRFANES